MSEQPAWRLTDEKAEAVLEPLVGIRDDAEYYRAAHRAIAAAQARLLVEWGYGLCIEHNNGRPWRFLCRDCRQQLRKEVGLE